MSHADPSDHFDVPVKVLDQIYREWSIKGFYKLEFLKFMVQNKDLVWEEVSSNKSLEKNSFVIDLEQEMFEAQLERS